MTTGRALEALRTARLRPTMARVALVQVLLDADPAAISTGDMYNALLQRGTPAAMGTVYRAAQELEDRGLLLREWSERHRKAMYRLKPKELDDLEHIRLVCRESGQAILLRKHDLHARLLEAGREAGFDLAGQTLSIHVDALKALRPAGVRTRPRLVAGRG